MRKQRSRSISSSEWVVLLAAAAFIVASVCMRRVILLVAVVWLPLGLAIGRFLRDHRWYESYRAIVPVVGWILFAHWSTYLLDDLFGNPLVREGQLDTYGYVLRPYCFAGFFAGLGMFLGAGSLRRPRRLHENLGNLTGEQRTADGTKARAG